MYTVHVFYGLFWEQLFRVPCGGNEINDPSSDWREERNSNTSCQVHYHYTVALGKWQIITDTSLLIASYCTYEEVLLNLMTELVRYINVVDMTICRCIKVQRNDQDKKCCRIYTTSRPLMKQFNLFIFVNCKYF